MTYTIIGLSFDLVGVILLFKFGILPDNLWEHLLMDSGMDEKDEKRHKNWSKVAIILIFIGFALQLTSAIIQHNPTKNRSQSEIYENKNLGEEKNQTTGIVGELKLKYQDSILYYQLELAGLTDSFNQITDFGINLEDIEGFKIKEINEEKNNRNPNLSKLNKKDSLYLTIKNNIPFTSKEYNEIKKWYLTIKK